MAHEETYLGDGAYAEFDGYSFVLYTSNGVEKQDIIYLEPAVMDAFMAFAALIKEKLQKN